MRRTSRTVAWSIFKSLTPVFVCWVLFFLPQSGAASDLPLADRSELAGFSFADHPMQLPVERNFQMAMITESANIGRSCSKIEAFGWHMNSGEQQRVNQIFTSTVKGLRDLGYKVESQTPSSVAKDVTLITADRKDKHFMQMWTAGDLGLVMVMCASSAAMHNHNATAYDLPAPEFSLQSEAVEATALVVPSSIKQTERVPSEFSPVGDWIGSYSCAQGYTGATLHIAHMNGRDFDGIFRFYSTPKNLSVPAGSYNVYGQYDRASKRILINPGQWIERPHNYYNTIVVGMFDPDHRKFSGYFQGVTGCTSIEASYAGSDLNVAGYKKTKKIHRHKKKSAAGKKSAISANHPTENISIVPDQPPPNMLTPAGGAASPPHVNVIPQKSGSIQPDKQFNIVLAASGDWYTPSVPQIQQAPHYNIQPPQQPSAASIQLNAPQVPTTQSTPPSSSYSTTAPQVPAEQQIAVPSAYVTSAPQVPSLPQISSAPTFVPTVPEAPKAQYLTVGSGAR